MKKLEQRLYWPQQDRARRAAVGWRKREPKRDRAMKEEGLLVLVNVRACMPVFMCVSSWKYF